MSAEPQGIFNFPAQPSGTTFKARSFIVTVNGSAPATTLTAVSIVFKKDGATTLTPSTTIVNAATWEFTVNTVAASSMGLAVGDHQYDIKTTDSAGTIEKYVSGVLPILPTQQ